MRGQLSVELTCGCKRGLGSQPCSSQFSTEHLLSVRVSCSELTRSELDMVVMGQLMAGVNDDITTTQHHVTGRSNVRESPAVFTTRGNRSVRRCSDFFTPLVKCGTGT